MLPDADVNPLQPHDFWMKKALDQAVAAWDQGEVPVGAIIVHKERVIAEACNLRETLNDPTAHAEMIAITQAAEELGSFQITSDIRLNHQSAVLGGVMRDYCRAILQQFFQEQRARGKK